MESLKFDKKIDSSLFKYEDAGNGLENYQINEEIGQGSFGKVYSAIDIHSGERRAIKKIVSNNNQHFCLLMPYRPIWSMEQSSWSGKSVF